MNFTPEFIKAVREKNILRLRIMLKDSLLVDTSFQLFQEMLKYIEQANINIWSQSDEELSIVVSEAWNKDLMNLELIRLVSDFTKEHVRYCQRIIRKVYGNTSNTVNDRRISNTRSQSQNRGFNQRTRTTKATNDDYDYKEIIRNTKKLTEIIRRNRTSNGYKWEYTDIDDIREYSRNIEQACRRIEERR